VLELSGISMHFGGLHVLHDVNIRIPQGAIFGLIGPNGAGKTTVFNIVTGLLTPNGGRVAFDGHGLIGL
jgi:branched-chain amino acid transport system ATP-binding protein